LLDCFSVVLVSISVEFFPQDANNNNNNNNSRNKLFFFNNNIKD